MIQINLGMQTIVKLDPFSERDAYVAEALWMPDGARKRKTSGPAFNDDTASGALRKLADYLDRGGWDAILAEVYPPSDAASYGPGADTSEDAA